MLKDKPKYANSTLPALAQKLSTIDLRQLAIKSKLIVRKTKKFDAEAFLLTLLKSVANGQASLRNMVIKLSQILDSPLSKQGLSYRFKPEGLKFLELVSQELQNADPICTLERKFSRVLLQDATQLRLPPQNSQHYKGISNQWSEKSSAKLDVITDLCTSNILAIEQENGTHQDRISANNLLNLINENDLILRDMGYFSTQALQEISQKNAFYISRIPSNTCIILENGTSIEKHLKTRCKNASTVDITAFISKRNPHKARVIAIRCPEEIANQKRAKTKAHQRKMKSKSNKFTLEREGWTIYVTNLEKTEYSGLEIHEVYNQRWAIEIQFRALKGSTQIRNLLGRIVKNKAHLSMLIQAVMIFAQLTATVHAGLRKVANQHGIPHLSQEKVASWFSDVVAGLKSFKQEVTYDLRHLSHETKRKIAPQSQRANSLF